MSLSAAEDAVLYPPPPIPRGVRAESELSEWTPRTVRGQSEQSEQSPSSPRTVRVQSEHKFLSTSLGLCSDSARTVLGQCSDSDCKGT